jgi:ubiquinol-cytochrome c reductase cytochrome b subunit
MSSRVGKLVDWLDDRAGVRSLVHEALYERVPGGARWRYVWGSTLVIAFLTQMITGIFLWMAYSPSTQTAWESVFYIQFEMPGGWLLRGIHHYMAHAMVILLGLHFAQVVWDGAYRAPRELNFVIGVVLMLVVFGLALTGYLLPWDQKGYWATSVGTNLASQAPLAGPDIKKLAIGGSDYGHLTLTRFFALHAGVLPGLLMLLLVPHLMLFRRHGLHAKDPQRGPDGTFWPDQLLKDSVAALGVLATVLMFAIYGGGAELTAPADPSNPYNAARPEWYFLFLFQFLKWFPGELEIWGAFIIPGILVALVFLMPWIGRSKGGHRFNVALLVLLLGGVTLLTAQAVYDDNFAKWNERTEANAAKFDASMAFLHAKGDAIHDAERIIELARSADRIPPTGALSLMQADPYLQGPRLFNQHCIACHTHEPWKGPEHLEEGEFKRLRVIVNDVHIINPRPTAPNLAQVGGRGWVGALLNPDRIGDRDHLGYHDSPFADGDMVTFVRDTFAKVDDQAQQEALEEASALIMIALTNEADLPDLRHAYSEASTQTLIEKGKELMKGGLAEIVPNGMSCVDCHKFHDAGELGMAPDLTGYMSRQWLIDFIRNPSAERFYGDRNDRMPAFAPHDDPRMNQLDDQTIGLIVDWLRGDWAYRREELGPIENNSSASN